MTDLRDHYVTLWGLSGIQPLAQTATSHVYTALYNNQTVVLKVLTAIGREDEREGAVALRYFDGQGAVRLLRYDDGAHLLEYADGDDLVPMVHADRDAEATQIIADVLTQLHSTAQPDHPPDDLKHLTRWFRSLFRRATADKTTGLDTIYRRGAAVAEALLGDQREPRVLHGDIHHENIRGSARGWLAFDPKGVFGDRAYDAANTLCNPGIPALVLNETRLLTNAGILAETLKIDLSHLLRYTFAYACLSAAWSEEDGQDGSLALGVAAIAERHIKSSK